MGNVENPVAGVDSIVGGQGVAVSEEKRHGAGYDGGNVGYQSNECIVEDILYKVKKVTVL